MDGLALSMFFFFLPFIHDGLCSFGLLCVCVGVFELELFICHGVQVEPIDPCPMSTFLRFLVFSACLCGVLGGDWRQSPLAFGARAKGGSVVNYAEVRARVARGFVEKANEMADAIAVLQDLSRATVGLNEQITKHCSK